MSFNGLGLSPELLRAVADQGYETPTPVQSAAIPLVLEGRDLLAGAQTGTGKTAAFVLPIIHRLHETRRDAGAARHQVRVLVVVPTRELAIQVEESVRTYGAHRPIRSATVYGGVGFGPQVSKLRAGPEIVVATPGRLLDHLGQGTLNLSSVEVLVLDEADRMLDMGFIRDIRKILAVLPPKRQNLLFSATFSDDITQLADGLLTNPAHVQVTPRNTTTELIDQLVIPVDRERKRDLLRELVALGRVSAGPGLHADEARREPARGAAAPGRHRGGRHPRQPQPVPAREGALGLQGGPRRRSSSPPTSRPAAWTSSSSRTWSTSSCRWSPRTTSTASAGPVAPASTARRSRSCAWTRRRSCVPSRGSSSA